MKSLSKLFNRRMDRKEFLVYLGLFCLSITGISSIIKNISNLDFTNNAGNKSGKKSVQGFGTGSYGGIKKENI